jgi:glycosyltransferase involved in cell wall biosynthesis
MPGRAQERCAYIPENGIDPAKFVRRERSGPGPVLRVAFVGRLVPYKGADMLLEAAEPLVKRGAIAVDIIGDGPQRGELAAMAERIGRGVTLAGWVEHARLQERLATADVLGFPSIREFGGGVVLEAMALGVVPLVVDYGGPGELVTPETGIAVPIGPRGEIVASIRRALERIVSDPSSLAGMAARAQERALTLFTWDAKAGQVLEVYRWVLGERARPEFGLGTAQGRREEVAGWAER